MGGQVRRCMGKGGCPPRPAAPEAAASAAEAAQRRRTAPAGTAQAATDPGSSCLAGPQTGPAGSWRSCCAAGPGQPCRWLHRVGCHGRMWRGARRGRASRRAALHEGSTAHTRSRQHARKACRRRSAPPRLPRGPACLTGRQLECEELDEGADKQAAVAVVVLLRQLRSRHSRRSGARSTTGRAGQAGRRRRQRARPAWCGKHGCGPPCVGADQHCPPQPPLTPDPTSSGASLYKP